MRSIVDYIHLRKFAVQEVVPPGSNVEYRDLPEPNSGDRTYWQQAPHILHIWMNQEDIT